MLRTFRIRHLRPSFRAVCFLCALFVLPGTGVGGTVLVPIEFRELVTSAPIIVHGRVTDVRAAFVDGRRAVETFVTVEALDYMKGDLGTHVTFRVPGGQVGRYRTVFVGAPQFREGSEAVLFLKADRAALPYIIGLSQGAYRVAPDARTGRRMVTTPIVVGGIDDAPRRVVRGDPARRPLPIESFREAVRQVLASQGAAK
jgi:hypothetical protein